MAIFEPIDILQIAKENGAKEYRNVIELEAELERVLQSPKYVIGYFKYREQIASIKRAISMLEGKEQVGYKILQKSLYLKKDISVALDTNEELNLFIQLNRIFETNEFLITDETRKGLLQNR